MQPYEYSDREAELIWAAAHDLGLDGRVIDGYDGRSARLSEVLGTGAWTAGLCYWIDRAAVLTVGKRIFEAVYICDSESPSGLRAATFDDDQQIPESYKACPVFSAEDGESLRYLLVRGGMKDALILGADNTVLLRTATVHGVDRNGVAIDFPTATEAAVYEFGRLFAERNMPALQRLWARTAAPTKQITPG